MDAERARIRPWWKPRKQRLAEIEKPSERAIALGRYKEKFAAAVASRQARNHPRHLRHPGPDRRTRPAGLERPLRPGSGARARARATLGIDRHPGPEPARLGRRPQLHPAHRSRVARRRRHPAGAGLLLGKPRPGRPARTLLRHLRGLTRTARPAARGRRRTNWPSSTATPCAATSPPPATSSAPPSPASSPNAAGARPRDGHWVDIPPCPGPRWC